MVSYIFVLILILLKSFISEETEKSKLILLASMNISKLIISVVFSFTDTYTYMINFERCYNFSKEIIIEEENLQKIN